jgi:hypothetical protein
MREIEAAIDAYKAKYGFYPPDNPSPNTTSPLIASPLYFELVGSTNNGVNYYTLDGRASIPMANVLGTFGVNAFINSSTSLKASDDRPAPENFMKELKPLQCQKVLGTNVLTSSEEYGVSGAAAPAPIVPWRYTTSHAVNNPGSYDLWVDMFYKGVKHRFSNWRKEPFIP